MIWPTYFSLKIFRLFKFNMYLYFLNTFYYVKPTKIQKRLNIDCTPVCLCLYNRLKVFVSHVITKLNNLIHSYLKKKKNVSIPAINILTGDELL